jgi:cytochrome b561
MLTNGESRYGLLSRALHWSSALFIVALIGVGLYMTGLDNEDPNRLGIYSLHKSVGALVLMLSLLRVLWILRSPAPPAPAALAPKEVMLSKVVQALLYALIFLVPISGWVMSSSAGYPVGFFGLFELPQLVGKDEGLHEIAQEVHELAAYGIAALVLLHIAGALKHRLKGSGPEADVLRRML